MTKIMPTSNWLTTMGTILNLYFGGQIVISGKLSLGAVVAFNTYVLMMLSRLRLLY